MPGKSIVHVPLAREDPAVVSRRRAAVERLENGSNGASDFALDSEDIGELAIVTLGPEMFVGRGADQLHVHVHGIGDLLHTPFKDMRYA